MLFKVFIGTFPLQMYYSLIIENLEYPKKKKAKQFPGSCHPGLPQPLLWFFLYSSQFPVFSMHVCIYIKDIQVHS